MTAMPDVLAPDLPRQRDLEQVARDIERERYRPAPADYKNKRRDLLAEIEALRERPSVRGGERW